MTPDEYKAYLAARASADFTHDQWDMFIGQLGGKAAVEAYAIRGEKSLQYRAAQEVRGST